MLPVAVRLNFLDRSRFPRSLVSLIEDSVEDARNRISELPAPDVEITFRVDANGVIPEWGVGGVTESPNEVQIAIDQDSWPRMLELTSTLVHELHHAIRWRYTSLDIDLADMLASEGLAVVFETDAMGIEPFYARGELPPASVQRAAEALTGLCDAKEWFFGGGSVPRFFGYTLGARLSRHCAQQTGLDAGSLIKLPSLDFVTREAVLHVVGLSQTS